MVQKRTRQRPPRGRALAGRPLSLTIEDVGQGGDGIARADGVRHFVPFALPGETVRALPVRRLADGVACRLVGIGGLSPERVAPFCPAFGHCGGCALQHWAAGPLAAWKTNRLRVALARRGFSDAPLAPLVVCPAASRRRATLALAGGILGFRALAEHAVVGIDACPVLRPELSALIVPLREALAPLAKAAEVALAWTAAGADVRIAAEIEPGWEILQSLAEAAQSLDLARLTWVGAAGIATPVAVRRIPRMTFGGVAVDLPPGAFLQASDEGEAALTLAVLKAAAGAERVADLFCGLGTFALPLAGGAKRVLAADADGAAIAALAAAARRGAPNLEALPRDLFRDPLTAAELAEFDAVVFDPPRAGAAAQAGQIAAAGVPKVVAVSCNPATLARDLRILCDAGYALTSLAPVDQFPFSAHLEAVAVLSRGT